MNDERFKTFLSECRKRVPFSELTGKSKESGADTPDEAAFLYDIYNNPYDTNSQRQSRLQLSNDKLGSLTKNLCKKGLIDIKPVKLQEGKGRPDTFSLLTEAGYQKIGCKRKIFTEKFEHELYKNIVCKFFESKGYDYEDEMPFNNHLIDIVATINTNETVAVEIETGKSDIEKNIRSIMNGSFKTIVIVTPVDKKISDSVKTRVLKAVTDKAEHIIFRSIAYYVKKNVKDE